jgi:TolB-like protein/Flp pilus assembly protein TadD
MARHAVDPVLPLRTVRPAVPQPAEAAVERALAKVPADRFATAGEFARALTAATIIRHGTARRRRLAAAALAVGLSIAAVLGAVFGPAFLSGGVALLESGKVAAEPRRFGDRSAKPTIAILPFTSTGSAVADDWLASGVHQETISHLGMLGGLAVIDRPSVLQYRDTIPPVATIVKQLGADYLLLGQVGHDSGGVEIAVELTDARLGRTVWGDSYQRLTSEAGIRAIRTDMVQAIAGALNVKINSVERARINGRGAENAAAYDLFARATQLDYASDPSASAAAAELLAQAIALDSGFVEAVAGLGAVYWARSYMLGESRSWADSALQLARRAIHLDPALPAAHHVLALGYLDQGRLGQAAATYSDIIRSNPNDGQALKVLGWIELLRGRLAESMALLLDAHAVAPTDEAVLLDLAVIERLCGNADRSRTLRQAAQALAPGGGPFIGPLLDEGRLGEAVSEAEAFLAAHPRSPRALAEAAKAAVASGDYLRARAHLDALSRTGPDDWDAWGLTYRTTYADVLLRVGERRRAMELLDTTLADARRLVEAGDERPGVLREIAAIYATRGEREQAFTWLARAVDAGWRLEMIHPSPLLEPLRGVRFGSISARVDADILRGKEQIEREGLNRRLEL